MKTLIYWHWNTHLLIYKVNTSKSDTCENTFYRVVCGSYSKRENAIAQIELLKSINKLINIKFISMEEFIKSYLFDYDEKTILYLIKNYNIGYEIALEYINNLYYVEDKKYNNEKIWIPMNWNTIIYTYLL